MGMFELYVGYKIGNGSSDSEFPVRLLGASVVGEAQAFGMQATFRREGQDIKLILKSDLGSVQDFLGYMKGNKPVIAGIDTYDFSNPAPYRGPEIDWKYDAMSNATFISGLFADVCSKAAKAAEDLNKTVGKAASNIDETVKKMKPALDYVSS